MQRIKQKNPQHFLNCFKLSTHWQFMVLILQAVPPGCVLYFHRVKRNIKLLNILQISLTITSNDTAD